MRQLGTQTRPIVPVGRFDITTTTMVLTAKVLVNGIADRLLRLYLAAI
jgi:hypothetical protein